MKFNTVLGTFALSTLQAYLAYASPVEIDSAGSPETYSLEVRSGQLELLEKYLLVCQAVHEQVEAVIHARRSGDIAVRLSEVQRDAVADRSSGVPGPQSAAGEGRPGKAFELTLLSRVETSR
ncbi:hypothetical protein E4U44_006658 [Claviceps purpurea]|nr:hypothetical protein E4U44_006658 [Claviceps purpurea]